VAGQRRLQAASDVLLGWAVGPEGRHWYFRQLQDQKGSAVVDAMALDDLASWGRLCGWALARGHARSGQPAEIAGYLGADKEFEHAIGAFAVAYADQNERDYGAFVAAIKAGRVAAEPGV
jgi:DNA-binding IclR family transcriptional regulator